MKRDLIYLWRDVKYCCKEYTKKDARQHIKDYKACFDLSPDIEKFLRKRIEVTGCRSQK